jgi:apolipoprotein N-acyltransferase
MSALRFSRPTAIALLLMTAAASLFALELTWMSPGAGDFRFAVATTFVGLVMALFAGAATVGLAALWNVLREKPLRRPVMAFGIGLAAFVGIQAFAVLAYQHYKSMRPVTDSAPPITSEAPTVKETK